MTPELRQACRRISEFMEPLQSVAGALGTARWWRYIDPWMEDPERETGLFSVLEICQDICRLGLLHEVEGKLSDVQAVKYEWLLMEEVGKHARPNRAAPLWHATAEQKIRVLEEVIVWATDGGLSSRS